MQTELEATIKQFLDQARTRYGNDSFAAGYFSSWIRQMGERDPKMGQNIINQLNYTMEVYSNVI